VIAGVGLTGSLEAQATRELQVQALGAFASAEFIGGGLGVALRTRGRARVGVTLNAGDLDGSLAGRAEAVASYHLNPYAVRGITPYAGGGVAVAATEVETFEYVVILVGVETTPGRRNGWFAEVGIGGGVRVSAGFRVRWRSRSRR
jgi:hypothetical protein